MRRRPIDALVGAGGDHTLAFGWATRLVVEVMTAAMAFVAGALIAHRLGPAGKGEVSTLGYLIAVVTTTGTLGLGEASATMHGLRKTSLARALSASLPLLAISSALCTAIIFGFSTLQLRSGVGSRTTVLAVSLSVPAIIGARALLGFLDAAHRVVLSSILRMLMTIATVGATWFLVIALDKSVTGAMAAPIVGAAGVSVLAAIALVRIGGSLRPRIDREYVGQALRYGSPLMTSLVILVLAGRADIFLVRAITDNAETGLYSVALTMSQLATYPSDSLLAAAFPRLARLEEVDRLPYVMRLTRAGISAAIISSLAIAAVSPVLIPVFFGDQFRPAIFPTIVLLVSVVLYGAQSLLTRARAAGGRPALAVSSFSVSLLTMVVFDVVLIPRFGIEGAAFASVLSSLTGFVVAARIYRRHYGAAFRVRDLLPRARDLIELRDLVRSALGRGDDAPPVSG